MCVCVCECVCVFYITTEEKKSLSWYHNKSISAFL